MPSSPCLIFRTSESNSSDNIKSTYDDSSSDKPKSYARLQSPFDSIYGLRCFTPQVALLPKNIHFESLYLVIPYCCRVGWMSEQAQLFWDHYLKTFVIEVPSRNRSPTAAAPIAATPDNFRALSPMTASFVTNPNAPRGSFFNPIPHLAKPATVAATPGPTSQASVYSFMCPQPNAAPLGSFHNPIPHGAFKPLENGAFAPASAALSPPAATVSAHATSVAFPPNRRWRPSAVEINTLFSSPRQSTLSPNRTAQHPGPTPSVAPARITLNRPRAPTPRGNGEQSSARNFGPSASQSSSQGTTNLRHQSLPRAIDFRHVRFEDEQARAQASHDAASRAAARARENEAEVLEFTDANAAVRLGLPYRGLPTPGSRSIHPKLQSTVQHPVTRALQPESRNSSTGSFKDANTRSSDVAYERWPLCTVCDNGPATIHKSGVRFCNACFGQTCAAEEVRKRMSRKR